MLTLRYQEPQGADYVGAMAGVLGRLLAAGHDDFAGAHGFDDLEL